jgi:hypothetical protein
MEITKFRLLKTAADGKVHTKREALNSPHCKPKSDRIRKPFTVYRDARFSDGTPVNHSTEFIPGRVTDHSLFADPTNLEAGNEPYIRKLELQKPALAKALKEGCWAQFQGQYFTCWDEGRGQEVPEDYHGPDVRMIIPFAEAPVEWWYPHFTGTDWNRDCGLGLVFFDPNRISQSPVIEEQVEPANPCPAFASDRDCRPVWQILPSAGTKY